MSNVRHFPKEKRKGYEDDWWIVCVPFWRYKQKLAQQPET